MSFADLKAQARQAVHDTLAVPALYRAKPQDGGVDITVRHHTKLAIHSPFDDGFAAVQEGINRLVFDRNALGDASIVLKRGDLIEVPDYGITLQLDQPEAEDGPVNAYWQVVNVST